MESQKTREILEKWFVAIGSGDGETIIAGLSPSIVFELPKDKWNAVIGYLGTHIGRDAVAEAFRIRAETTQVLAYELRELVVDGSTAYAQIYTKAVHTRTKAPFEIEDSHRLEVDEQGRISRWKVYFDPNCEVAAFTADHDERLLDAVRSADIAAVRSLLSSGANPNHRNATSGLTVLQAAAGLGNADTVRALIAAGGDVYSTDNRAGGSALHKAVQNGDLETVRVLVEAGTFIDVVAPTTGHTPLMDALWYKWPDIVEYLLSKDAGLGLSTHYGFSMREHFEYELNVNTRGKEQLLKAEQLLKDRTERDQRRIDEHTLMTAVTAGNIESVRSQLASGADVDSRYPFVNGFNDDHTPLLVASRDGHTDIVRELLAAGADVNATEPTFGAVPLHKAVYNGHADITEVLVATERVDLDFQGATNGYTPLHDALWHGYERCAQVLIGAGARLDLVGHDGKTPRDIAVETFGPDHPLVRDLTTTA
ncbi:ankyrin repeat domain-containing protein [Streptomyces sp. H27-C3]|uniref:ankyrin repeat domain-containing protein n=1 Tax=Streptomyces sp. H27-C3 TaxID=3046305 RepID=UPI0024B93DB7|nr:ankyrin repeat domain-containing protein [Streptomyces sp. H27-C3]MDJ0466573.1 ankyrin repeat domain-containing protein [Streptomyces sp. H27-C3]